MRRSESRRCRGRRNRSHRGHPPPTEVRRRPVWKQEEKNAPHRKEAEQCTHTEEKQKNNPSRRPHRIRKTVPPVIIKLDEPERRHHTCIEFTVRGFPHPTLKWFHKGSEIKSRYIHMEVEVYKDYLEGCLTFENPTHHDNGNYTLVATNPLGSVTKTVFGHFLEAPPFPDMDGDPTPGNDVNRPDEDSFGMSIAVGLAAFGCVFLIVMFVLINKYGRRNKYGMKVFDQSMALISKVQCFHRSQQPFSIISLLSCKSAGEAVHTVCEQTQITNLLGKQPVILKKNTTHWHRGGCKSLLVFKTNAVVFVELYCTKSVSS
ncbi:hypothetical protein QTP70_006570 [Hemibagrus guttatus]|uniref:Immunoglobulin I-set domain-containing protein n=1 Tax=Hemibagrus guttatus TaxID=175788 RepID=A0AAE0QU90_9TELE|nr:hypothetical protein QTP70_006570 [Hemibagrus guttatus]